MPKITDPDLLNQNLEVRFITGSKIITLIPTGSITASAGVSMQALYSFMKEEWRTDSSLIKYPFPMEAITSEQFEFINGWDLSGSLATGPSGSKAMIRDAGWAKKNAAGNSVEEYMNMTSLGSFADNALDQAYYIQTASLFAPISSSTYIGPLNEPILIYSSQSGQVSDARDNFTIYLREYGKGYGIYNLISEQNITELTYRKYALPLASSTDVKITHNDSAMTGSPYSSMSIGYSTSSFTRTIGASNYNFKILINGNSGTAEQIYEYVQFRLRSATDIDSGSNYSQIIGKIAEPLLQFTGDTLKTLRATVNGTASGVYIDNFQVSDTNRLQFTDDGGTVRTFPYVAAGTLNFNNNLSNDAAARYFVFYTNDDAGDNTGRDFGSPTAIVIESNSDLQLTGSVNGSSSLSFDFDYDGNIQRGNASSGSDAPFTAVAVGLATAQYVVTTGTITRSTSNLISYVASLERNYANT